MSVDTDYPITVVLAFNLDDFERWCREHDLNPRSRHLVFASTPAKVDGMRDFDVVRTTRARWRWNYPQIAAVVQRNLRKQGR